MIKEMRIADIMSMPSVDSDASYVPGGQSWDIATALADKDLSQHGWLIDQMERDGYNRVPVHIDYGVNMADVYDLEIPDDLKDVLMFGNGHHRLMIAMLLGFTTIMVTNDACESDGDGEPQYSWSDHDEELHNYTV
jgi:hypothetical protein